MTSQQKVILGAGAAGAFLLWQSKRGAIDPKTGKPVAKTGLLSKLLPARGTNSPYVASTNMATRNGQAGAPRPPSSGLGYGTDARGVAQAPTTAGAIALGAGGVLKSLFDFLGKKTTAPKPATKAPTSGSSAPRSGGSGGASGGGGGRQSSPMGGAAGVAGGGNSDSSTPIQGGSFDDNGNFIADTSSATPVVSGAFDENGNWNPDEDPGVEELPADPLDATPIGNGDFQTQPDEIFVDPISFDSGDVSSGVDDTAFAGVTADDVNGGDSEDNFDYFDY